MEYKFIPELAAEFAMPDDGIMSRVLHKDERLNVTLFGFSAGQELSTHSAPTPALLYFLQGEANLRLGSDIVQAKTGTFVYMPPMLPHGISAKTPVMMLLVQVKEATSGCGEHHPRIGGRRIPVNGVFLHRSSGSWDFISTWSSAMAFPNDPRRVVPSIQRRIGTGMQICLLTKANRSGRYRLAGRRFRVSRRRDNRGVGGHRRS